MDCNLDLSDEITVGTKKNCAKKHTVALQDEVYQKLRTFTKSANEKSRGKNISVADIIKYAASLIKTNDITKIQNQSLSIKDKIEIEYEKHNKRSGDCLTFDEYLALKLKIH